MIPMTARMTSAASDPAMSSAALRLRISTPRPLVPPTHVVALGRKAKRAAPRFDKGGKEGKHPPTNGLGGKAEPEPAQKQGRGRPLRPVWEPKKVGPPAAAQQGKLPNRPPAPP